MATAVLNPAGPSMYLKTPGDLLVRSDSNPMCVFFNGGLPQRYDGPVVTRGIISAPQPCNPPHNTVAASCPSNKLAAVTILTFLTGDELYN